MSQKRIGILWLGLLFLSTIVIILCAVLTKKSLKKNHLITSATIFGTQNGSRGNAGHFFVEYSITVDGKEFHSSSSYLNNQLSFFAVRNHFVGKKFPAVYYPSNPSISSLMLTPDNFDQFNYPFPDSLNWVLQ